MKFIKSIVFFKIMFFSLVFAYAQQVNETITFMTYYPSPKGEYRMLRLWPQDTPPSSPERGELYYNNSSHMLQVYNGSQWADVIGKGISTPSNMDPYAPLANSIHTVRECVRKGGEPVDSDVAGFKICRFQGNSCPTGWNRYKSYLSASNIYESKECPGTYTTLCGPATYCTYFTCRCYLGVAFDLPWGNNYNLCKETCCECPPGYSYPCCGKVCLDEFTEVGCI